MYITIPVLISRHFDDVEAKDAGVPAGKERDAREIEFELEKLLAPHDYDTTLNIPSGEWPQQERRTVPNYNARFDFWDVQAGFFQMFEDDLGCVEVEHMIYPQEYARGHEVIAASDLPLDVAYDALVTPDGRYHEFRSSEPPETAAARREEILREHSECLAAVCKAHI